jgi:hypothetical protein
MIPHRASNGVDSRRNGNGRPNTSMRSSNYELTWSPAMLVRLLMLSTLVLTLTYVFTRPYIPSILSTDPTNNNNDYDVIGAARTSIAVNTNGNNKGGKKKRVISVITAAVDAPLCAPYNDTILGQNNCQCRWGYYGSRGGPCIGIFLQISIFSQLKSLLRSIMISYLLMVCKLGCPAGRFSWGGHDIACQSCPIGRYNPKVIGTCLDCPRRMCCRRYHLFVLWLRPLGSTHLL